VYCGSSSVISNQGALLDTKKWRSGAYTWNLDSIKSDAHGRIKRRRLPSRVSPFRA
jgi:hypothetical protein